ncbi:hypothetical protein ELY21_06300 [Legionella sp. km535]|uniref:CsiV family protein n=1 Tax=Legionella sp. km535 TaxID=2498107 RepID=UPI000F8E831F|nr:CsiV family protein [Legionella sp. km535]RUR18829.1 hypothetical protein ELY21_06300 [Legionella sp. km535]
MLRFLIITINILYSSFTLAQSSYQIDLILFTHPENGSTHSELDSSSPIIPVSHDAIPLKKNTGKTISSYSLLSPSQSGLKNEYYLLSHKSRYKVLGHYSWRQPAKNQSSVALPELNHNGWIVQGTIRVKQSNYYLLDTDIHFSPSNNPQSSLTIAQKQRLKGSEVYYLDHPRVGMLIKIHKIA